jgi:hypothetical protein
LRGLAMPPPPNNNSFSRDTKHLCGEKKEKKISLMKDRFYFKKLKLLSMGI